MPLTGALSDVAAGSTAALIGLGGLAAWRSRHSRRVRQPHGIGQETLPVSVEAGTGRVPPRESVSPASEEAGHRDAAESAPRAIRRAGQPMVVTFSGLDGAGKSTLIGLLRKDLEAERRQVAVLHFGDDISVYGQLRRARDLVTGRRTASVAPGQADPRSQKHLRPRRHGWRGHAARLREVILWNKLVRRFLYPVDALIFLTYRWNLSRRHYSVVLMDRYFYDWLVDVSDGQQSWWVRLLERLTPVPTVAVHLDITPEESYHRKSEFSLEYLRDRAEAYHRVLGRVPTVFRIVNDDLERTRATLRRVVAERGGAV